MNRRDGSETPPDGIDAYAYDRLAEVFPDAPAEQLHALYGMLSESGLSASRLRDAGVDSLSSGGNSKIGQVRIPVTAEEIVAKIGSRPRKIDNEQDVLSTLVDAGFTNIPQPLSMPRKGVLLENKVQGYQKLPEEFTKRDITKITRFILHLENQPPERPIHRVTRHGEDPFCSILPVTSPNPSAAYFSPRLRWMEKQDAPLEAAEAKNSGTYLEFINATGLRENVKNEAALQYIHEENALERYAVYRDHLAGVLQNYPLPYLPPWEWKQGETPLDFRVSDLDIHPLQRRFTHGDMSANNILFMDYGDPSFIDFEHAGFNHPGYDVATLVAHNTMLDLPPERRIQAIEEYENKSPQPEELVQRLRPLVVATHILWAARSLLGTSENSLARRTHANPDIDTDAYVQKQIDNTERHFGRIETYLDEFDL